MTSGCRQLLLALLVAVLVGVGCSPPGAYWRSRGADLLDVVPVSVATGWGIGGSLQATPLFQMGLSVTPMVSQHYGFADRTFYGRWSEYNLHFPWVFWAEELTGIPELPSVHDHFGSRGVPLTFRWQAMRDATSGEDAESMREFNSRLGEGTRGHMWEPNAQSWGRHPPIVREWRGAFLLPAQGGLLEFRDARLHQADPDVIAVLGSTERASLWETRRVRRSSSRKWDLFEADALLLFLGLRVGVRPVEFLDLLTGFVMLDPLGDDLPGPLEWAPEGRPPESPDA